MSKYIIEIKPEYEDKFKGVMILGAENSNLYVDSNTVNELEELTADYINEHFGDLQDTAYQKGFEDGKAQSERGCEGCQYQTRTVFDEPCVRCSNAYKSQWKAEPKPCDIIRNGIQNWITELNVRAEDIKKILEDMRHD